MAGCPPCPTPCGWPRHGERDDPDDRAKVVRRLRCFALFWHALDIVWVAIFTVVYLIGAR